MLAAATAIGFDIRAGIILIAFVIIITIFIMDVIGGSNAITITTVF